MIKKSIKAVGTNLLSEDKASYVEQRKFVLEKRKQELQFEKLKKQEQSEQTSNKLQKGFFNAINPSRDRSAFNPQRFKPVQELSPAQKMFQEVIGGGEQTWGTGQNLPQMNGALTSGGGIIKNGDYGRETAHMFGF